MGFMEQFMPALGQIGGQLLQQLGSRPAPSGLGGMNMFAAPARGSTVGSFGQVGRRKSRTGVSARDIRGAQKVARLVQHFGYKPKIKARKRRR